MSFGRFLVFLTFVLACCAQPAHAAKTLGNPNLDDPSQPEAPPENEAEIRKSIDIAEPPPLPAGSEKHQEYFYRYRQALTGHIGLVYDTKTAADGGGLLSRLGTQFMWMTEARNVYEAGADLLSDGAGSIQISQRRVWGQGRFRPYIKAGPGVRIVPSDQLATFLKHEHYQVRLAAGFERLVKDRHQVRLELDLMASGRSQSVALLLGGVFPW